MVKSTKLTVKNKGGDLKKIGMNILKAPFELGKKFVSGTKTLGQTLKNKLSGRGKKGKKTANRKKIPAKKRKAKNGSKK
jgi:hypothetical protein